MLTPFILSVLAGILFVVGLHYGLQLLSWLARKLPHLIPSRYRHQDSSQDDHVQVLVLGDIGRSPRMQYHALSLAKHGCKVDLVGYKETARHPSLIGNPQVSMFALSPTPEWIAWGTLPFFINLPCKVIHQFFSLIWTLMYATPPARLILLQNPPSIPTFHVALFVSFVRGSKIIVDWHNYGYSILAQKSLYRPLVPLYRWYEVGLGRRIGDANLAVSDAMARDLRGNRFQLKTPVYVLHDRPAAIFQPMASKQDRLAFLSRLNETSKHAQDIVDGAVRLIVSSTSWTPDEDFGLLLDSLVAYADADADADNGGAPSEPRRPIIAIITGKGPEKAKYISRIQELELANRLPGVQILTTWLSNRDYAALLASADLGVSLHKSSSGYDLPMKVVDMFGAGLPVAAYSSFASFAELVQEGINGCGFETSAQLAVILRRLLSDQGASELAKMKQGAIKEGSLRWDDEWDRVVAGLIQKAGANSNRGGPHTSE